MQPLVDGRRQAERFYQLMHKTDASIRRGHRSLRHFILNVSAPENGLLQIVREIKLVQPFNDSSLACPTSTCHNSVHSKSLRDCDGSVCEHKSNTAKRRRISSFLFSFANSANGYAFLRSSSPLKNRLFRSGGANRRLPAARVADWPAPTENSLSMV